MQLANKAANEVVDSVVFPSCCSKLSVFSAAGSVLSGEPLFGDPYHVAYS
jgi:hypothetical protein